MHSAGYEEYVAEISAVPAHFLCWLATICEQTCSSNSQMHGFTLSIAVMHILRRQQDCWSSYRDVMMFAVRLNAHSRSKWRFAIKQNYMHIISLYLHILGILLPKSFQKKYAAKNGRYLVPTQ